MTEPAPKVVPFGGSYVTAMDLQDTLRELITDAECAAALADGRLRVHLDQIVTTRGPVTSVTLSPIEPPPARRRVTLLAVFGLGLLFGPIVAFGWRLLARFFGWPL